MILLIHLVLNLLLHLVDYLCLELGQQVQYRLPVHGLADEGVLKQGAHCYSHFPRRRSIQVGTGRK